MFGIIAKLEGLKPETLELIGTAITAGTTLVAAIIVALIAHFLSKRWLSARDVQDKEVEWRNHAVELTKLDLERTLKCRPDGDTTPIRPSILDFLANYRDLQELGSKAPKDLYLKILADRITVKQPSQPAQGAPATQPTASAPAATERPTK